MCCFMCPLVGVRGAAWFVLSVPRSLKDTQVPPQSEAATMNVKIPMGRRRRGASNVLTVGLLATTISLLLILLVVVIADKFLKPPVQGSGRLTPPKAIGDSQRIEDARLTGRTYRVVVKAAFDEHRWKTKTTLSVR